MFILNKVMKNYLFHRRVDVSKLKLDVNILNVSSFLSEHFVIENNQSDNKFFKNDNQKRELISMKVCFCCENTDVYTNHLVHVFV